MGPARDRRLRHERAKLRDGPARATNHPTLKKLVDAGVQSNRDARRAARDRSKSLTGRFDSFDPLIKAAKTLGFKTVFHLQPSVILDLLRSISYNHQLAIPRSRSATSESSGGRFGPLGPLYLSAAVASIEHVNPSGSSDDPPILESLPSNLVVTYIMLMDAMSIRVTESEGRGVFPTSEMARWTTPVDLQPQLVQQVESALDPQCKAETAKPEEEKEEEAEGEVREEAEGKEFPVVLAVEHAPGRHILLDDD